MTTETGGGGGGHCRYGSLPRGSVFQANLEGIYAIIRWLCVLVENGKRLIETEFGIGISKGCNIFGSFHHLFNFPWVDDKMSQSVQKVQPPYTEHVVHDDEFFLGDSLRSRNSYPSLVRLHPTISSMFVGGMRPFVSQIPSMDVILMGYWVAIQVSTMRSNFMLKSKFRMGDMNLRKVLIISCGVLLRDHLRNTRNISLLVSGRGIFDDLGCAILQLW